MKNVTLIIAAMMVSLANARGFDVGKFTRTMHEVQRTVDQVGQTVQPIAAPLGSNRLQFPGERPPMEHVASPTGQYETSHPVVSSAYVPPSEYGTRGVAKMKPGFRESMGPKARLLANALDWLADRILSPVSEWMQTLDENQRILFYILAGGGALIPFILVLVAAHGEERMRVVTKSASGLSAFAGAIFTVWAGFEIGGEVGEWLSIAIMALMGFSVLVALIGGPCCGRRIVFKIFAPFMLMEMILVVFVVAMLVTTVFIVLVVIGLALWFVSAAADSNTVYKCSRCGRTFHGKPSSCPCGAVFD